MNYSYDKSLGNISRMVSKSLGKKLESKLAEQEIFINVEQWSVISLLFQKEKLSQVEIGTKLGLDKVRILRIIMSLEKETLLKRVVSKTDKRYNSVCLTHEGNELYHKIVPFAIEVHKEAFLTINKKDVEFCLNILEKINNNLR